VNKIRYAPEVASRPDRLAKDLENAKVLAAILEDQAAKLRAAKIALLKAPVVKQEGEGVKAEGRDADMTAPEDDEDPEPKESGSNAVERRIEKVMSDMRDQGLVDINDERVYEEKKVRPSASCNILHNSPFLFFLSASQVVVSLDLYLDYLRAAFNTCYYCAVVTDHVEELQRKCLKHERKPLSKALLEEIRVAEVEKAEKERKVKEEEDKEMEDTSDDKSKVKEKENGRAKHDPRDWKRNGVFSFCSRWQALLIYIIDERWLEWLDSKIALLINRDGVDPRDYGGKSYEE
jgi:hypothetical protein